MAPLPGSGAGLSGVPFGGLINEDVMNKIWQITDEKLPYIDLVGSDSCDNAYTEWTEDALADQTVGGWVVDGADSNTDDTAHGERIGNHCGALSKEVRVTQRANASDTIGYSNALSYQVMQRQKELRFKVEANLLGIQGSQADDGDTTPGIVAGLQTMMTQHASGTDGTGGGFSNGAWAAWTPGSVGVGLTEVMIRDACQAAWESGANPSELMSVPTVIRALSGYMFSDSARIATLTAETNQNGPATAMGAVNVFLTDFGVTLRMTPNRLQRTYATVDTNPAAGVFIFDPGYFRVSYLDGYRTEPLAKTGTSDKRQMTVDFTQKALNRDAGRVLCDISPAIAVIEGS